MNTVTNNPEESAADQPLPTGGHRRRFDREAGPEMTEPKSWSVDESQPRRKCKTLPTSAGPALLCAAGQYF
ncbi:hypothetical protein PJO50_29530, partial [Mycobacterium kansasii]